MQIFSLPQMMQNISFLMSPRQTFKSLMFCIIQGKLKIAFQSLIVNKAIHVLLMHSWTYAKIVIKHEFSIH